MNIALIVAGCLLLALGVAHLVDGYRASTMRLDDGRDPRSFMLTGIRRGAFWGIAGWACIGIGVLRTVTL